MIIAGILFLMGILIGLSFGYAAIIAASITMTLIIIPLWLIRAEFGLITFLAWLGYLLALQSGFLVGGYVRTDADEG
ncbi:hypothetical protein ASE63_18720 [Bosea sp. Root381]|uniref:hypothetical protein n=1 Tax=Bosea sp. Root381 TaxID=1736524 RepID=UPI0006F31C6B|nr:hypothetical protein [Bosea sp. Root381]KRE13501.1 hypothetical protein ASE63_18720 [Bosea sp. Root381]